MPSTKNARNSFIFQDKNKLLKELSSKIYTDDEIKEFRLDEAINDHPLARRPVNIRSKLAYKEILNNVKPTTKYLLPGQCVLFNYAYPKYIDELEYYDATPFTIFFGLIRTKQNTIREVGINLHYFPPYARERVMNAIYVTFSQYFNKYFNTPSEKPTPFITYKALKAINRNKKIAFALKMYVPVNRGKTFVVPTRLLPTCYYTEGHFSKATMQQIFRFWRSFRR